MTKQEVIIKEWMNLGIKTPFGVCDNTGFIISYCINGIEDIYLEFPTIKDKIEVVYSDNDILSWRPKSIQGIENNNCWIKIESENDLPKTIGDYFVFDGKQIYTQHFEHNVFWKKQWINITHYQPITKPEPPKY